ncbi:MAG TPA: T9SS type A sorting domain-containing protein [Saprospiraceae bacterium]|nr:T9SS type A sorting domain-containing protein [Saprospiraceae bacterium]
MRIDLCTSVRRLQNLLLLFILFLAGAMNAQVTISGRVTLPTNIPLDGLPIFISGTVNDMTLTDVNGEYHITVPSGGSYSVRPFANAYPLNGVSTYDLALLRRHLLGIEQLDSPYKLIAADVDDSEEFSQDTSLISNLIYGITDEFPGGESWRFIRADHVFTDPMHPFPFPRTYDITNLTADLNNVDFIGVKLGDLNYSAYIFLNGTWLTDDLHYARVIGKVTWDENNNCTQDASEQPIKGWKMVATGAPGTFVVNTRADGTYTLRLPDGNFNLSLVKPNNLWQVCTPIQNITVAQDDTLTRHFSVQADKYCPHLEVDLTSALLRRCFAGYYVASYINRGTATAEDAHIEVELDPFLTYTGSTIPGTLVSGNTYSFPLGDVVPGGQGWVAIDVAVSCESVLGQTHCSTAHIFPDTLCGPPIGLWDGANLRVTGVCNGTEVTFTVLNEGDDMEAPAGYVIVEDIMIQMNSEQLQLNHDETETFTLPANGSTWRLEVAQTPNHPFTTRSSAAVEGCGTNPSGTVSQGLITVFPQDDDPVFVDEDCHVNVGSYDPNDKQGYPTGVGVQHYIPRNEEIEYVIRFQNTGTDTAFTVMVLDTISQLFDLTTLRPGASSQPYTFNQLSEGIAQFVFSNIMLPDSNVNEAASHGFVKFTISPKADLPDETQLENQAGIYFDFNEPVITNRTLHTIGENYLEITNVVNLQPDVALNVFPNPTRTDATFQLKTDRSMNGTLFVYDLQGREVKRFEFTENTFKVNITGLPSGHYLFRVDVGGQGVSTGKIVVEK